MKTLLSILFGSVLAFGGPTASAGSYWFSPGIGGSSAGLAAILNFSQVNQHLIFSVRLAHSAEIQLFEEPGESVNDFGISLGIAGKSERGAVVSLSAGLGLVSGVRRGATIETGFLISVHERINYSTAGLLLQAELYGAGSFGVTFFGNINRETSFGGAALTFRLGRFKK